MNEYYWIALAAIISIYIIFFLYQKTWPFIHNIKKAFEELRLDPKSTLTEKQYKKRSIGSLYALQQGACLNSLRTDIKYKLPTILGEWWDIHNTEKAIETLEYLSSKGHAYYLPFVYLAFQLEDEQAQDDVFQQNITSQEDYEKATMQFYNLKETYNELASNEVLSTSANETTKTNAFRKRMK